MTRLKVGTFPAHLRLDYARRWDNSARRWADNPPEWDVSQSKVRRLRAAKVVVHYMYARDGPTCCAA